MAKDSRSSNKYPPEGDGQEHHCKSNSEAEPDPDSDSESEDSKRNKKKKKKSSSGKRRTSSSSKRRRREDSYSSSSYSDYSDSYESDSEYSDYSESEDERRRRRKERKKREEKRRRRGKEDKDDKKRKRKDKDKKVKKKKKDSKKKKDKEKKGAVTNSWGKYGIIRETDMWNKRPEFTAWLAEVKKVNLESLPNWEEKQLFKDFMEDHNTATFPSKKYYNLDAYYQHKMEKDIKKGVAKVMESERTVFNDEEQRRLELQRERERQKEEQVEALKRSMQGGMAQAMKEQAQLREEMAYQYKLGNFEAAAAIQRRLDPDVAM